MDWVALIAGGLLLLFCLAQLTLWTSQAMGRHWSERDYWRLQRQLLSAKIAALHHQRSTGESEGQLEPSGQTNPLHPAGQTKAPGPSSLTGAPRTDNRESTLAWRGWRTFQIKKLVRETASTTSVYLAPQDELDLPEYRPGQFLTIKVMLPNQPAPQIRCYSLSGPPQASLYRITVKDIHGQAVSSGGVSHFINWRWAVGDTIEVKAPGGDFYLDLQRREPAILLAGGVGITPLMSMIETVLQRDDRRDLLLFYGIRNGSDHLFRERLKELASRHVNFNVLTCYSHPEPQDVAGRDYHIHGRVSLDLLQRALPSPAFDFYLCGPGAFMTSLHQQLTGWGVPAERIHYEAFGPATVVQTNSPNTASTNPQSGAPSQSSSQPRTRVQFTKCGKSLDWQDTDTSLLEAGLAAGVPLSSGCRAGQCGACQTKLLRGEVDYPGPQPLDVAPGHCLPCIAVPRANSASDQEIVLDA
jgi:hypothetical protein